MEDPEEFLDMFISNVVHDKGKFDYLSKLPCEILEFIQSYLPLTTVLSLSGVSKLFHDLSYSPKLWLNLFQKRFVFTELEHSINSADWKKEYIDRYSFEKSLRERYFSRFILGLGNFDLVSSSRNFFVAHPISDPLSYDMVFIWDLDNRKERTISPDETSVPSCTSVKNDIVCIGMCNGQVHVLYPEKKYSYSPKILSRDFDNNIESHVSAVTSGGSYTFIGGYENGTIAIWKLTPYYLGEEKPHIYKEHSSPIEQIIILDNHNHFITRSYNSIRIWDLGLEKVLHAYDSNGKITCVTIDNHHVYCGIENSIVKLSISTGQVDKIILTRATVKSLLVNQKLIVLEDRLLCDDSNIKIFDKQTGELLHNLFSNFPVVSILLCNYWYIISGHLEGTICIWDSMGNILRKIYPEGSKHVSSINLVDSGIVITERRQLSYLSWIDTSWKQKYQFYENQLPYITLNKTQPTTSPKEKVDSKPEEPLTKKRHKLYSFWDCK